MYSNDMVMSKSGEKRCDEVMYSNDMVMSKAAEKRGDEHVFFYMNLFQDLFCRF